MKTAQTLQNAQCCKKESNYPKERISVFFTPIRQDFHFF